MQIKLINYFGKFGKYRKENEALAKVIKVRSFVNMYTFVII